MFTIVLPYYNESDIKRAEWVVDELYNGNESVKVTPLYAGYKVKIECKKDTRIKTAHFEGV